MNKFIYPLLILITFLIITIVIFDTKRQPSIIINNQQFKIDLAKTKIEREKGLSIYSSLPLDKGMLFLFNTADYYSFWMKDMKFPIDIIYISNDRIVDIYQNLAEPKSKNQLPVSVEPRQKADKVLEINAGLSKKYNFKIDDLVKIKI